MASMFNVSAPMSRALVGCVIMRSFAFVSESKRKMNQIGLLLAIDVRTLCAQSETVVRRVFAAFITHIGFEMPSQLE